MRISKLFTCVVAAAALLLDAGCSSQNETALQYRQAQGYASIPAGAVIDPATGVVTYPQASSESAYASAAYVSAPAAPVVVKPRRTRQRGKVRYIRGNTRFAKANARTAPLYLVPDAMPEPVLQTVPQYAPQTVQYAPQPVQYVPQPVQYEPDSFLQSVLQPAPQPVLQPAAPQPVPYMANSYALQYIAPDYGTASLLTNPNLVPSVTTAPFSMPVSVGVPYAPQPVQSVAPAFPSAGGSYRVAYRRGRRVKMPRARRQAAPAPYAVAAPAYASPYASPYTYTLPFSEPAPLISSPVETTTVAAAEPTASIVSPQPAPLAESQPAAIQTVAEPVVQTQQPVVQPIVLQPIIQPIIQASAQPMQQQYAETAALQAAAPMPVPPLMDALPSVQEPVRIPVPEQQVPVQIQAAAPGFPQFAPPAPQTGVVGEPVSALFSFPWNSGVEEPEISLALCAPGQNLSECFTMNDYQLQNTPVQVLRPNVGSASAFAAPAAGAPASLAAVSAPVPIAVPVAVPVAAPAAPSVEMNKYEALTPPRDFAEQERRMSVRPDPRRPEVVMPTPLGNGEIMPPVPAAAEIESALDVMLSGDTGTPILK